MRDYFTSTINILPPLPKTAMQMQAICSDPESSLSDLIRVVEKDPMIVANLLKAASSSLYGFRKDIASVGQAVSLFGMNMTQAIGVNGLVKGLLDVDMEPYTICPDRLASASSVQAVLASKWYKDIDKQKAERLFFVAFLQEIGKIIIASKIKLDGTKADFISAIGDDYNYFNAERKYVEATTAGVTALVFSHWGFSHDIVQMISYSDAPSKAPPELIELSAALNVIRIIAPVGNPLNKVSIANGIEKAKKYGLDVAKLEAAIASVSASL